jgi:hypothetical protein
MPIMVYEARVQYDGGRPVVSRTPFDVDSIQQLTLKVPAGVLNKKKVVPGKATYPLLIQNPRLAVLLPGGSADGKVSLKLGKARTEVLKQPLVLDGRRAAALGVKGFSIEITNESLSERSVSLIVGAGVPASKLTKPAPPANNPPPAANLAALARAKGGKKRAAKPQKKPIAKRARRAKKGRR